MTREDYVSFEIAKLLKEKGFDSENVSEFGGYYIDYYHNGKFPGIATESMMLNETLSYWEYLRPTLQMAMKWLREVHYYSIETDSLGMMELNTLCWRSTVIYLINGNECYCEHGFDSYEEACEAAIKYCLENLL